MRNLDLGEVVATALLLAAVKWAGWTLGVALWTYLKLKGLV